eukprot:CAMPEP_0119188780 /NCGR_PEP_ID=MMETSP1316-20130426/292_1 /TAXON_ID=41880 /ORGANISM="Pycnococcus provasolii, Strain RCC2336" /LENGTH=94 /DNA_ID=CAMNT_0007183293 /DNA_START=8 /DNA_END=289 /DNA_ORIENTATION=+
MVVPASNVVKQHVACTGTSHVPRAAQGRAQGRRSAPSVICMASTAPAKRGKKLVGPPMGPPAKTNDGGGGGGDGDGWGDMAKNWIPNIAFLVGG